jgi:hypothetical protein
MTKNNGYFYVKTYIYICGDISRLFLLRLRNISDGSFREIQTHIFHAVYEIMYTISSRTDHRRKCGACALHTGYLRLHTHTQNMLYMLFHSNSDGTNAPRCYLTPCTYSYIACLVTLLKPSGSCIYHVLWHLRCTDLFILILTTNNSNISLEY